MSRERELDVMKGAARSLLTEIGTQFGQRGFVSTEC